jgi:hypothetical protein
MVLYGVQGPHSPVKFTSRRHIGSFVRNADLLLDNRNSSASIIWQATQEVNLQFVQTFQTFFTCCNDGTYVLLAVEVSTSHDLPFTCGQESTRLSTLSRRTFEKLMKLGPFLCLVRVRRSNVCVERYWLELDEEVKEVKEVSKGD